MSAVFFYLRLRIYTILYYRTSSTAYYYIILCNFALCSKTPFAHERRRRCVSHDAARISLQQCSNDIKRRNVSMMKLLAEKAQIDHCTQHMSCARNIYYIIVVGVHNTYADLVPDIIYRFLMSTTDYTTVDCTYYKI